jgi:predicted metal-binding membrane protein
MNGTAGQRRAFVAAGLGLAATAWALLAVWDASPWARYLDHGDWTRAGVLGSLCAAVPWGEALLPAGLYVAGWILMLTAMMLPTALPVLAILRQMTARRRGGGWLVVLAAAGYLAAWGGFGLAAHAADLAVGAAVERVPWLVFNGWALAALVLLAAGLFQFSELKRRCLDHCHSPLAVVTGAWRGRRPAREAWRLGLTHGAFCVGCCWALMLIMFVVGTGNLGWMLALALVMAAEKNLPWGRRLSAPLGAALLGWSAAVVMLHAA